jgi:ATP-dependent RNA helicase DHX8/PRP22
MLKAMGINDLLRFDFMDPPPVNTMLAALEELYALGALDDEGILTRLGRRIADFPLDSSLAKVLVLAGELGCSDEILSIVAMLNLPNVFYRPKEKQAQADQKKAKFHDPSGDHLTLLNVYNSWKQSGYSSSWCFENFVLARSMRQAKDVREQLVKIMERYRQPIVSCGRETDRVRRALCAGYFHNAARRETEAGAGAYKTVAQGTQVYMHPSSALFGKQAEWLIYHELVLTSHEYMHWTTSIEPKWLVEAAPTFFKLAGANGTLSKRRLQEGLSRCTTSLRTRTTGGCQRRGGLAGAAAVVRGLRWQLMGETRGLGRVDGRLCLHYFVLLASVARSSLIDNTCSAAGSNILGEGHGKTYGDRIAPALITGVRTFLSMCPSERPRIQWMLGVLTFSGSLGGVMHLDRLPR